MKDFQPFANNTQSISVGPDNGFTFENSEEGINIYGDLTITKQTDIEKIDELIQMLQILKTSIDNKLV